MSNKAMGQAEVLAKKAKFTGKKNFHLRGLLS